MACLTQAQMEHGCKLSFLSGEQHKRLENTITYM